MNIIRLLQYELRYCNFPTLTKVNNFSILSKVRVSDPDPGSGLDPYSIGPVDPDPYSESGSGSGTVISLS
jgi:hypothetical protein